MASQWFYQVKGERIGPISGAELRNLAQRGTISTETAIANAPNGPWVPAARVKGLFATPNGVPPSTPVTKTAQVPSPDPAAQDEPSGLSTATWIVMGVCGGVCALIVGLLVWFIATRDTWEVDNTPRVLAKLEEADRLQQSDPFTAYKTYDELLKEVKQHKITGTLLAQKLTDAEKSRTVLYSKVQDKIRAEEAEKQRLADEEARRVAAEKQRVAEEEQRKRAADEAQRIAEEKRRAEEKRCLEVVSLYRSAPPSARTALNAVKKIEARAEVGINYENYSTVVGEGWADVKIFVESPEGKKLSEFSFLLVSAMGKYKLALGIWRVKVEMGPYPTIRTPGAEDAADAILQRCWGAAHRRIDMAESLISRDDVATVLTEVVKSQKTDADYEATVHSLTLRLEKAYSSVSESRERTEDEKEVKAISQEMNDADMHDKQGP